MGRVVGPDQRGQRNPSSSGSMNANSPQLQGRTSRRPELVRHLLRSPRSHPLAELLGRDCAPAPPTKKRPPIRRRPDRRRARPGDHRCVQGPDRRRPAAPPQRAGRRRRAGRIRRAARHPRCPSRPTSGRRSARLARLPRRHRRRTCPTTTTPPSSPATSRTPTDGLDPSRGARRRPLHRTPRRRSLVDARRRADGHRPRPDAAPHRLDVVLPDQHRADAAHRPRRPLRPPERPVHVLHRLRRASSTASPRRSPGTRAAAPGRASPTATATSRASKPSPTASSGRSPPSPPTSGWRRRSSARPGAPSPTRRCTSSTRCRPAAKPTSPASTRRRSSDVNAVHPQKALTACTYQLGPKGRRERKWGWFFRCRACLGWFAC
jgi:hypothetical protein